MNRNDSKDLKSAIEYLRDSAEQPQQEPDSSQDTPQNPRPIDRIEEAKTDEAVESYNARKSVRRSIGRVGVWLIYAAGVLTIVIIVIFLCCLALDPFYKEAADIEKNFEPLFDKIVQTAPWVLLFIFGDAKKLSKLIENND